MQRLDRTFEVVIVGAGQAGIEAALASARMGRKTACVTLRLDRIGHLPCNCSIGGPAKGHMAREVDALGGQMGVTTDFALTHMRRVGTGKGPAVQTLRAHVCKELYPRLMQKALRAEPNLTLIEAQVETVLTRDGHVVGIQIASAEGDVARLDCRAVVLTTGTFLNGLCHRGKEQTVAARHGDQAVAGLSAFLRDLGVNMRRFKTGTTPRIRFNSIDSAELDVLESQSDAGAMSFLHSRPFPVNAPYDCWQTCTNPETHDVLGSSLDQSPMFSGQIQGVGPRYCPSVEDKVVRFAGKDRHPIFLEIEEWNGESVYVQGFSTSMPPEVQLQALRTIKGLENVDVIRYGYAVEYDMADPIQLRPTLMSKLLEGLFLAGQVNGTSGYEEAAAQGIVAGINAARFAADEPEAVFGRDEAFLGVMIDDLVTKGVEDPYRMLTARAEHRLILRHDNADQRLTPIGRELGLVSAARWERFSRKMEALECGVDALKSIDVTTKNSAMIEGMGHAPILNRTSLYDLMRRPEVSFADAQRVAADLGKPSDFIAIENDSLLATEVRDQIELTAKYEGYLEIQRRTADQSRKLDEIRIPLGFAYADQKGLSFESVEKLGRIQPTSVGQASRIPGVRPTDIALLVGLLRRQAEARSA